MNQATTFRLWRVLAGGANPCAAMYFGPNPELGIGSVLFQLVAPAFMPAIADPSLRSESVIFLDFWPFSST
jgi:hypothetical protein